MPLTEFQRVVLRLLAVNRGSASFVAGGGAINAAPQSPRYSVDVDIFHDAVEEVAAAAALDFATLEQAGFVTKWLLRQPGFQRAFVTCEGQGLKLEWTQDSAFRFFPVQADAEFGWRLHIADLATNKMLALAGRWEARDFVDVLYLDAGFASLGLLAWAAAGKDPGLTPDFILEQANRFNRMRPEGFLEVLGTDQFDFVAMKTRWRERVEAARELVENLPVEQVGALYLDARDQPVDPRRVADARVHYASLGGSVPQIVGNANPLPADHERQSDDQIRQRYGRDR